MSILKKIRKILFGSNIRRQLIESINEVKGIKTPWYSKVWTKFLNFGNHWFYELFVIPFETIQRMIFWAWKMRYNYEFECNSIYLTIYLQLNLMIDYSKEYAHLCWNRNYDGKEMRKLRVACELAKRLWKNEYNAHMNLSKKKWNVSSDDFLFKSHRIEHKSDQGLQKEQLRRKLQDFRIADKADEKQKSNERKYLYKLLEKHLEGWWD